MLGYRFTKYEPLEKKGKHNFDDLLRIFLQLLVHTNGDAAEALSWMTQLDQRYQLTDEQYGIGDFIEDLKRQGYMDEDPGNGQIRITPRTEQQIRKSALEEIFGK
ncbi:MAG: hypothetical protein HC842_09165 [Cytophagales bacterium]|nr:hypothetical protein [Cytophagales bacterium]